jgi:carbamate kinase
MENLVVIAVGGNSLIKDPDDRSVYDQYMAAGETSEHIAGIVEQGHRVVITHGNGPQVGFTLLRYEMDKEASHKVPLDTCGANTQGAIGYHVTQTLGNELRRRGLAREVAALVTQVVVDGKDPEFEDPSKPIGPFYSEASAQEHLRKGWVMGEDAGGGWGGLVPSPRPLGIIEEPAIRALLEQNFVVVAVGGGLVSAREEPRG